MPEADRCRCYSGRMVSQETPQTVLPGCLVLFMSGCATTCPANPPLQQVVPGAGYEYRNVRKESGKGDTLQRGQAG